MNGLSGLGSKDYNQLMIERNQKHSSKEKAFSVDEFKRLYEESMEPKGEKEKKEEDNKVARLGTDTTSLSLNPATENNTTTYRINKVGTQQSQGLYSEAQAINLSLVNNLQSNPNNQK